MQYPTDSFYKNHSLHLDLNRTGKEEFQIMAGNLKKFGINSSHKSTTSSLTTVKLIHESVLKYGKTEQKNCLRYLRKNKITGNIIPVDITLTHDIFQFLMNNIDPYYTAALLLLGLKNSLLNIIKKIKSKDPFDEQTKKIIKKIIENDNKDIIIKKIIEIHFEYDENKKTKNKKTKKVKKR